MSNNDMVKKIYDLIEQGATYKDWQVAQEIKKQNEEIRAKQKQLSKEEHTRIQAEKQKFENCFIINWSQKHVYPDELYLCTQTCTLTDVENFANQMLHGKYRDKFQKDSFDNALTYLTARIAERKAHAKTPTINEDSATKASEPTIPAINPKMEYSR